MEEKPILPDGMIYFCSALWVESVLPLSTSLLQRHQVYRWKVDQAIRNMAAGDWEKGIV